MSNITVVRIKDTSRYFSDVKNDRKGVQNCPLLCRMVLILECISNSDIKEESKMKMLSSRKIISSCFNLKA